MKILNMIERQIDRLSRLSLLDIDSLSLIWFFLILKHTTSKKLIKMLPNVYKY